ANPSRVSRLLPHDHSLGWTSSGGRINFSPFLKLQHLLADELIQQFHERSIDSFQLRDFA
ncbi:MAG: hypothetical protein EBZ01_10905, partial [Betaproteobacteria bacterium]|nr:hypothetical protein [Betaproteobacteria bacterium]